jgi:hypothetical protein
LSAYAGKLLHVAIDAHGVIGVMTNDSDAPIATCVDEGTAQLFAAALTMRKALSMIALGQDAEGDLSRPEMMRLAAASLPKAAS